MGKTYTGDELAERVFFLSLAGIGCAISVIVLFVMW
jgi:hypothetical protein